MTCAQICAREHPNWSRFYPLHPKHQGRVIQSVTRPYNELQVSQIGLGNRCSLSKAHGLILRRVREVGRASAASHRGKRSGVMTDVKSRTDLRTNREQNTPEQHETPWT